MPDILHRVGINASPQKVFAALATIEGLQHWWVAAASGNAKPGGVIDFGFCTMWVAAAKPKKLVHWRCVSGPKEWIGTEVSFKLKQEDGQTFVLFKHAGWNKAVDFMHHCSTKWATFLLSLRDWVERAEGRPAPYDLKIHVGD
jgi:uncharacterized protein YndB with AHSA1/START domain